jgi:hypothetical protein
MKFNRLRNIVRKSIFTASQFSDSERRSKYCGIYNSYVKISSKEVILYYQNYSDKHTIVPMALFRTLDHMTKFKTLYEHASFIEDNKIATFKEAINHQKKLLDLSLLICESEFLSAISKNRSNNGLKPIDTFCWITRNRIESLRKSLESFFKDREVSKNQQFIVFDDSGNKEYLKNMSNVAFLRKKFKANIKLVGKSDRQNLLRNLKLMLENKVPEEVLEYALFGLSSFNCQTGANRNVFLLYTKDKLTILSDDDIYFDLARNGNHNMLSLTSNASFQDISCEFYCDQNKLTETINTDDLDSLEIHQRLLGQPLSEIVRKFNKAISLKQLSSKEVIKNLRNEKKIRLTMMGVAGDSGAGLPIDKLFYPSSMLVPLISDLDNFSKKIRSRIVLQTFKSFTVGPPSFLLGMNLGMDNTDILPPFHPNLRNSDGIFAAVLSKCFPDAYIGHLPFAISHIPPETRKVDISDLKSNRIRIPDILKRSIDLFVNNSTTPEGGLRLLGVFLRNLSERSDASLNEYFVYLNAQIKSNMLSHIDHLYQMHKGINKEWEDLVLLKMETLDGALRHHNKLIEFEEISGLNYEHQLRQMRAVYRNFGDLLYYWPEIYGSAPGLVQNRG